MRRACGWLTALGALAATAWAPAAATAAPCRPRAEVTGDTAAVARVTAELAKLGDAASGDGVVCTDKAIAATVATEPDGSISVAVHTERRDVGDAALAAAWIDSWLRDDLEGPALGPPGTAPVHPAAVALPTAPTDASLGDDVTPAPRARSRWDDVSLGAAFEQQWSTDGRRWTGVSIAPCVRVGAFCLGARARYAAQAFAVSATGADRSDAALFATAAYERDLGRLVIAPEIGIGAGRAATARVEGCKQAPNMGPMPGCTPPDDAPDAIVVGDHFQHTSYTPRAEAALRISIPLFDHVWLDGLASAELAPFGHGDPFDYVPGSSPPPMASPQQIQIPGEAFASFQLGIGMRVGGP